MSCTGEEMIEVLRNLHDKYSCRKLTTRLPEGQYHPSPIEFFCLKFPDGRYSSNSLATSKKDVMDKFSASEWNTMLEEGYSVVRCVLTEKV